MRKIITLIICFVCIFSLCACTNTKTEDEETLGEVYSVGLSDDGRYVDFDALAPEYNYNITVSEDELIDSITSRLATEIGANTTLDDYLELYANDFLSAMELDLKDVVEMTDAVIVSLSFTDKNGEAMTEYAQQSQTYVVKEDADAIISSFLTHKVGDQYTVEYTFPEDDEYHPGETVDVNVTIECIYYSDALHSGVVEAHLEELNEVLSNVKDAETLKIALRPYVLGYHLQDYIEEKIMGADIVVPSVWIEYEEARLGYRLTALSMTREQYLQEMNFTEEDIAISCECIARENMIAMLLYPKSFDPLTEEELNLAYGAENIDYYIGMQGQPYLKLRLMRSMVYAELAKNTPVLDANGNPLDLSIYFGEEESAETGIAPSDKTPAETTPTN